MSVWTIADEFGASAVQERDKLSNDRLYKIVATRVCLAGFFECQKVIINYSASSAGIGIGLGPKL